MTLATAPASSSALSLDLIITCADGLEAPLQTELTSFGITSEIKSTGRLSVTGDLRDLYTICLWSRVASRVLMLIKRKNINMDAFSEFLIGNWKDRMTTRLYFQRMESWNKVCAEDDQNRLKYEDNDMNKSINKG